MDNQPTPQSPTPEQTPGANPAERLSTASAEVASAAPSAADSGPATPPPALPVLPSDPVAAAAAPPPPSGAGAMQTPAEAADVDVIEKEWVDQAEAAVRQHQNDPYNEEEAVEKLQVDYLKKRYDHSVDKPED